MLASLCGTAAEADTPIEWGKERWSEIEHWPEFDICVPLGDKVEFEVKPKIRIKNQKKYYFKTYVGATAKLTKRFNLSVYYSYKRERNEEGWHDERSGVVDGALRWQLDKISLSDRNRLGYSFDEKDWLYSNKLKIEKPFYPWSHKITGFAADEVFYDFEKDKLNRNHFSFGFSTKLTKHIKLENSYLLESEREKANWETDSAVSVKPKIRF
jgi:hypothetical protein